MAESGELRWRSALLEGIAVLVAILVAFSIDAWWDVRSQRVEASEYLEAIQTELLANRELLNSQLETLRRWMVESETFLNTGVAPGASPSYDQVSQMIWDTSPNRTRPVARAALDDLISSGGFRVIDSAELRRALADYERSLTRDTEQQDDVRVHHNRLVSPYHVGRGSFTEVPWEELVGLPESPVTFPLKVENFVGSREYANLLIVRILEYHDVRVAHAEVLEKIDKALGLLDGAI